MIQTGAFVYPANDSIAPLKVVVMRDIEHNNYNDIECGQCKYMQWKWYKFDMGMLLGAFMYSKVVNKNKNWYQPNTEYMVMKRNWHWRVILDTSISFPV